MSYSSGGCEVQDGPELERGESLFSQVVSYCCVFVWYKDKQMVSLKPFWKGTSSTHKARLMT